MTDLHEALAKAMTTKQVEERLQMKDGELLRFLGVHSELTPPKFGNRYVWTEDHVKAVEGFLSGIKAGTICEKCGQPKPPETDGSTESVNTQAVDLTIKKEGGGDARE